jgi:transcriptional regulator with XRE-family HTH domain
MSAGGQKNVTSKLAPGSTRVKTCRSYLIPVREGMEHMGSWTKADLNRLRHQMTIQQRSIDEIAEEIRHHCACSKLAAYRMAHGWSQPQAAERYLQATGGFMDQPLLSKLELFPSSGTRAPTACQLIGFAAVYATTPLRLIASDALDQLDPHEREVLGSLQCRVHPSSPAFSSAPARVSRDGTHG